jgi:hypothetical protein
MGIGTSPVPDAIEALRRSRVAAVVRHPAGLIAVVGEDRVRGWWSTEMFVSADAVVRRARGTGRAA